MWYNKGVAYPNLQQKGGVLVDLLINFLCSVVAGIISGYICKWLDRRFKGN